MGGIKQRGKRLVVMISSVGSAHSDNLAREVVSTNMHFEPLTMPARLGAVLLYLPFTLAAYLEAGAVGEEYDG